MPGVVLAPRHTYTQSEYLDLMDRFRREGIPFTVAVLDMDWHMTDVDAQYGSGWTGYTWNRELFPDPRRLLADSVCGCSRLIGHVPNTLGCPSTSSTARSTLSGESSSTLHPSRESTPSSRADGCWPICISVD